MKTLVNLFLLLFIVSNSQIPKSGFGEGMISINQYAFSNVNLVPKDLSSLTDQQASSYFTYFIKRDKILRNDLERDSSAAIKNTNAVAGINIATTFKASMVHPSYLIDWNKRMVYTFFKNKGVPEISEKALKDEQTEYFFRLIDSNKTIIKSLEKTTPTFIINKKCFKGLAITKNGDSLSFYYTPTLFKVHSPLNNFLPSDFPYEVLRIKASVNWTGKDGKPGMGVIIFQVSEMKECKLADSTFILPENVKIRKNVPWQELYSPQQ